MRKTETTDSTLTFGRLSLRVAFVVGLLLILALPQLRAESPSGLFATLKDFLVSIPPLTWLLILLGVALVLWLVTLPSRRVAGLESSQSPAATLPISQAVSPTNGGNGLVSKPFEPRLPWLGLVGWVHIQDAGKECVVVDGQRLFTRTELLVSPMRLLGRPVSARRILLQPAPLTDISAESLTSDQLRLTLVVSAKYAVLDPAYVASLQAPLTELGNLITGAVAEYIRSDTLENIVRDDGRLREVLRRRLEASPSISGRFSILEILKALPTGDERIIEVIRSTREAIQKQALIQQEGQNRQIEAEYDLAIKQDVAALENKIRQQEHEREMERAILLQGAETQRELLRAVAAIAAAGINPAQAIGQIRSVVLAPPSIRTPLPLEDPARSAKPFDLERERLEEVKDVLGIQRIDLEPSQTQPDQPGTAWLAFEGFAVFLDCPDRYPEAAPSVRLQVGQEPPKAISVPWQTGARLADAAVAAAMQARAMGC